MRGIHGTLWSAGNNGRSYWFGRPASWLTKHWGSGISAYDFFMALNELADLKRWKSWALGDFAICIFFPLAMCAGTQVHGHSRWPDLPFLMRSGNECLWLCERMNPAHTVSAGSYAFKNLMALKEQLLSHLNFATPCVLLSRWFRLLQE